MRLRIRFTKLGKVRWTSHRDVARMWERAFRRVGLPLAYSEGFTPRPKVSFGLALPTGHESMAEYLDVELSDAAAGAPDLVALKARLSAALPEGIEVAALCELEPGSPSLQEDVEACSWRWLAVPGEGSLPLSVDDLGKRVAHALAAPALEVARWRKGRETTVDIRPGIGRLEVVEADGEGVWLDADLAARPQGVRPADVLAALGPDLEERHVRRTHQWIVRRGERLEPLGSQGVPQAPHAEARAS